MKVTIIGCGVMGLTCGLELQAAGFETEILARELPPHTTSNWAAAIWYPYRAYPVEKVLGWSALTFQRFQSLIADSTTGVKNVTLVELFPESKPDPWWKEAVADFRRATADELPDGYTDAFVISVPVIDTHLYMDYLVQSYLSSGGTITQRDLASLSELTEAPLIINCAGLGSRELVNDREVYPIRGQIVKVKATGVAQSYIDEIGPRMLSYIVPRTHDIILGGTAQEHSWDTDPDPDTAAGILRKCKELVPELADAEIIQHGVGLRPGRHQVRLERELLDDGQIVIHNYGHGGAGFTLSWGCAAEVVQLARESLPS